MPLLFALLACDDAFNQAPADPGEPGSIVRFERVARVGAFALGLAAGEGSARGAEVYRVLYATTGLDGAPDVASLRLAVPDDAGDAMLVHLHGTVGLADRCAPSRDGGLGFEGSPLVARALARGRTVVAPDLLGLGPPGPHPYLDVAFTRSAVLDGLIAASRFEDPARGLSVGPPSSVWLEGHSQGGHAVLAALSEPSDVPWAGALAIAAPGDLGELLPALVQTDRHVGFAALALAGLTAANPEDAEPWLDPDLSAKLTDRLERDCLLGLTDVIGRPADRVLADDLLADLSAGRPVPAALTELLARGTPSSVEPGVPLTFLHGHDDPLLPVDLTRAHAAALAETGADVTFLAVAGDHATLPWTARDAAFEVLDLIP